jgi:hypothetical protein
VPVRPAFMGVPTHKTTIRAQGAFKLPGTEVARVKGLDISVDWAPDISAER